MINKKICKKIIIIFVISLATILLNSNYSMGVKIDENYNSKVTVNLNLTNAPYNNKEYCESKLNKSYTVKLAENSEQSNCMNYPTKIEFEDKGILNEETHTYTKTGVIDFSKTSFGNIGDYYFDICDENGDSIYQIIVTFRYLDGDMVSQILIKSILLNGEKVDKVEIDIDNPNTCLLIKKQKDKNAIAEDVFVDLSIYGYNNENFTVLKNNSQVGKHNVIRKENNEIAKQTYSLANDDIVIVGESNEESMIVAKVASINGISNLRLASNNNIAKKYQIPVGTKYKVEKTSGKNYREQYEITLDGEIRVAQENPEENEIIIKNLTHSNPKTGVFYTVLPFVFTIIIAIIGIIIIKKTSSREDENDED